MNSLAHGSDTSSIAITNISAHGFQLLNHGTEFFLSHEAFPWFEGQSAKALCRVQELSAGHYHWPGIDVDLTRDTIENPDRFPLRAK
jgi:hypothetical protein